MLNIFSTRHHFIHALEIQVGLKKLCISSKINLYKFDVNDYVLC